MLIQITASGVYVNASQVLYVKCIPPVLFSSMKHKIGWRVKIYFISKDEGMEFRMETEADTIKFSNDIAEKINQALMMKG